MTLFVYVGGVDVSNSLRLEGGIQELTQAADGQSTECVITVDDPSGSMTFQELAPVIANETACTPQRCFTGIVTVVSEARGPFRVGAGRIWNLTITDLNELLHRRVLHLASAKRPAETGTARLNWLLTTVGMSGVVYDNGKIMANAWLYDEADYRGQYADDVLASIVSASVTHRWTFFVYFDDATGQPSLFYGDVTTTTYDSTLSLSNILADKNDTTIFAPNEDSDIVSEGGPIYDGVYVAWDTGKLYLQRASTFATYGVHRDFVMESTRINNAVTANRHANTFLDIHAAPEQTIHCVVKLPASKVNLIEAGHRISVKFSHIAGYTTYTYTRVSRRTFTFTPGTNESYDLHLELSTKGIGQTGGGAPGTFPQPPVIPVSLGYNDNSGAAGHDGSLPGGAPATGDTLVLFVASRTAAAPLGPKAGWTLQANTVATDTLFGPAPSYAALYSKSASGDGANPYTPGAGECFTIENWGSSAFGSTINLDNQFGGTLNPGSITVAVAAVISTCSIEQAADFNAFSVAPDFGVTEKADFQVGGVMPFIWEGQKSVSAAGTYSVGGTLTCSDPTRRFWGAISYSVLGSASANPPLPAQWVFGELVTLTAGAGTTAFPFADGSLKVRYDIIDQTPAIVSYNGATGAFVMPSQPPFGTQVFVDYQGR